MRKLLIWMLAMWAILICIGCEPATSINFARKHDQIKQVLPASLPVQAVSDEEAAILDDVVPLSMSLKAQAGRVLVLSYHDVLANDAKNVVESDIKIKQFEEQMHALYTAGCNVITVDELYRHLAFGDKVPPRAVCITFDDNYQGVKDFAVPVLQRYEFPFAVYVHTDFVGNKKIGRPKMTWSDLKELISNHNCTVGSHTASHPVDIRLLSPAEIRMELAKSKEVLETNLGLKVNFLAWPHGRSDSFSVQIARQAGYKMAFGTEIGEAEASASMLQVNRFPNNRFERGLSQLLETDKKGMVLAEMELNSPYSAFRTDEIGKTAIAQVKFGGVAQQELDEIYNEVVSLQVRGEAEEDIPNTEVKALKVIETSEVALMEKAKVVEISNKRIPSYERARSPIVLAHNKFALMMPRMHHTFSKEYEFKSSVPAGSSVYRGEYWLLRSGKSMVEDLSSDQVGPRSQYIIGWRSDGSLVTAKLDRLVSISELHDLAKQYGCVEAMTLGPSMLKSPFEN